MNLPPTIQSAADLVGQFEYDQARPLQVQEAGKERRGGAVIEDVSYAGLGQGRIACYWVTPAAGNAFRAVMYVHPGPGSRATFLDEAVMLAALGSASLLVEAPWSQVETFGPMMASPGTARQSLTRYIIDLRRGVDLIAGRPGVSADQIRYVGHSLGAAIGGVLSGVEKRLRAFVLMAGTGSFGDVVALNMPFLEEPALEAYRQALAPIDPVYYVSRAAPSALFFQFGTQDDFFSHEKYQQYAAAGSDPKRVEWYETGHYFEDEKARRDRLDWITQ